MPSWSGSALKKRGIPFVVAGNSNCRQSDVLQKPVLVPEQEVTSLGSAIFAFLAAGVFETVEEAQEALCPSYRVINPRPQAQSTYEELQGLYRKLYFSYGIPESEPVGLGEVLPQLQRIAARRKQ